MPTPITTLSQLAIELQEDARRHRHRRLILLSGEVDGCRRQARQLVTALAAERPLWVGESAPDGVASLRNAQARERLGGELDLLIYDAFCGFDPDAFGALGGTLRGGGVLLLLTPSLAEWPGYPDPQQQRMVTAGYEACSAGGLFQRRLASILQSDPWVLPVVDGEPLSAFRPASGSAQPSPGAIGECLTPDQQQAVEAIEHVAKGHGRRPLVLNSDRGRGKSSALGIAAARLMREKSRRLWVTGPRRSAVDALFEQAARLLPGAELKRAELRYGDSRLAYSAPDHLLAEPQPAELLLVDEAAAIPTALLEGLLARYPRLVFATTIHGYEGTGRGFALRFKAHLDREMPQWRELRLETAIRWAADDPLEPLLFRLLGLNANPAPDEAVTQATPESIEPMLPDGAWLLRHEATLQQLFGLLVLAHYRTTPLDFRLLLDAPNLQTLLLRHGEAVAGVALLSAEGGFDPAMSHQIWAGRRRPKGHMLAQSLAAHLGLASAPGLKGLRVMRIAVHPAARRRGLGSLLLDRIRSYAEEQGFDYLGASFGVSEGVFDFWRANGLEPVRLGLRSGTSSGDHSVLMIAPLSRDGEAMAEQAMHRFARQLPALLGDPLRELPPSLACRLLAASEVGERVSLSDDDWSDLAGFAFDLRGYESSLPAIEQLALKGVGDCELSLPQRELLVLRVIQKRGWSQCARLCGLSGRNETEKQLRLIMARLHQRFAQPPHSRTKQSG
ncbi:MAG: GNAT family N-acetyltransferase [Candidatus Thiodiazotropha sp.]